MSDPLRQILDDCAARLQADAYFADIAILPFLADSTEEEIAKRLGTAKGQSGKVGACVLVMLPTVAVPSPNLPGPQFQVRQSFTVLEHPEINNGTIGTKKPAGAIAREVVRLFHHAYTGKGVQVWNAGADAIVPETGFRKLAGYTITLAAAWGQESVNRLPTPTIAATGSGPVSATLACADAAAALWFTLDGSYPWPGNPTAALYAEPLSIATAATLRVVAYRTGYQASNTATATIS